MSRVAVLCGGKGTRLGEPIKCLTEVAGRPFMDWKLEQLRRCGATEIVLLAGPFASAFEVRYGLRCIPDAQEGIEATLRAYGPEWDIGWWTMGDVLLEQKIDNDDRIVGQEGLDYVDVGYVTGGTQIGGMWLDCGLYYGMGPWRMIETRAEPWTINTPEDREGTDAHLRGQCLTR